MGTQVAMSHQTLGGVLSLSLSLSLPLSLSLCLSLCLSLSLSLSLPLSLPLSLSAQQLHDDPESRTNQHGCVESNLLGAPKVLLPTHPTRARLC
jgi:hypothetical protein